MDLNTKAIWKRRLAHGGCYLILLAVAVICFFPFYAMLMGSTHDNLAITTTLTLTPGDHFAENYARMMQNKDIWGGFRNSMILAITNTALCLYFSALTGYAFAKFDFRGKNALFTVIMVVMVLPGQLGVIGFFQLIRDMKLLNSYVPLVIPAVSNCFAVFFFKQYIESGLPNEMIEAALIDGCNEIKIYHTIVLPCVGAALVT